MVIQNNFKQLVGSYDINVDDDGSNRVRVIADVDLGVVSKTLVARGLIGYTSSTLKCGLLGFKHQISIRSRLLENLTPTNTFLLLSIEINCNCQLKANLNDTCKPRKEVCQFGRRKEEFIF